MIRHTYWEMENLKTPNFPEISRHDFPGDTILYLLSSVSLKKKRIADDLFNPNTN